jgi:hypothetical protein
MGVEEVVDLPTTFATEYLAEVEEAPPATTSASWPAFSDAISGGGTAMESQSWFGQFNAHRVALKLQALGADGDASIDAGRAVQNYVLSRVTRRRIRRFLKERDALWESGSGGGAPPSATAPIVPLDDRDGARAAGGMTTTSSPGGGASSSSSSSAAGGGGSFDLDDVLDVMTEYGLTGNDISAVFAHTPSVAMMRARMTEDGGAHGMIDGGEEEEAADMGDGGGGGGGGERESYSLEETLNRAFVGLLGDTLRLRRYDARKVLRATSGLLTPRGSASAVQVVNLMVGLGSSANAIARDKSSLPTLLTRSPALLFRLVAFLSSAQFKVPLDVIGPILRQRQSAELLDAVAPPPVGRPLLLAPYYARDDDVDDDDDDDASGANNSTPPFAGVRQRKIEESYRKMEDVADVLRRSGGIRDFRKILSSHPGAFFLNVTNVHLITTFLRDDVGMTRDDVAKVIQAFPTLLEQDASKMRDVVEFLLSIEVDREDDLPSILRSFPTTLLLDVDRDMIPVVSFLRDIGVRNIGRFVTRIPPVLGYSVDDDLRPKWDFLREVCQFDYFEVVRFPAYFSYPLERVIKLRYEYLRDIKGIPILLARVDDVLRFGDRDFATEIALDDDDGVAFAKIVEERGRSHGSRRKKIT